MSEKSYDPRMHTAEHILNQTMVRMFGCERSKNTHIERKKSKCDYHLAKEPSQQQLQQIEQQVNEVINSDLLVTDEMVDKKLAAVFLDLSKLPLDAPETIRVIRVGNYDACACIGPHVRRTSEIGKFKITTVSYNNGILRIRFRLN
jgi:alanyl-tRNA synthetase